MKLRTKDFPKLQNWLEKKTDKYTSHEIQNEILLLMAHEILRELSSDIQDSFFATICDEYTDISNKEQLTLCLRWIDESFEVKEDFFGFYELENNKSDTIVAAIRDILLRTQISLDNCRGQCYDGASNMLGKKSGVAKQIQDIQPKAFVTHCHCHSLSLSVKETTKESKLLSDAIDIGAEIAILIKFSPKREQKLEAIKISSGEEETANRVSKFSATRWTVRANCFQRILDNYCYLYQLWEKCLEEPGLNREVKARIIGCKSQMESFDLYFSFRLGKLLYSHTDKLSQTPQTENMSAVSSKRLAMLTVETIRTLRNEERFNALYDLCEKEIEKIDFIKEPTLKRKRKAPKYSMLNYVDGYHSRSDAHHPTNPRDHYREKFYQAVDVMVSSVNDRFDQPSFKVFEKLESLMIKALNGQDTSSEVKFVKKTFGTDIDVDDLVVELSTFNVLLKDRSIEHFNDLIKQMKLLPEAEKKLLNNVCKICKILAVNPASSSTAERTFSLARRVKTWMRSTMLPSRFNSVSILHFHKDRTDKLDIIKIANSFIQTNENRSRVFGRFTENDL